MYLTTNTDIIISIIIAIIIIIIAINSLRANIMNIRIPICAIINTWYIIAAVLFSFLPAMQPTNACNANIKRIRPKPPPNKNRNTMIRSNNDHHITKRAYDKATMFLCSVKSMSTIIPLGATMPAGTAWAKGGSTFCSVCNQVILVSSWFWFSAGCPMTMLLAGPGPILGVQGSMRFLAILSLNFLNI